MIKDNIKQEALADLVQFIRLVAPHRVIPAFHEELIGWWTREEAKSHQITLLPRDHAKSAMIAYRVAWEITKNPSIRVLYISATANLAEKQLKMIKDILTSPIYRKYWPEMVNEDEGKREKWTQSEIAVDHPLRKMEGIRDSTIFTGGLTTSLTGLHCDIAVLDDVVVMENAYTNEGREKVKSQYSLLSSIESSDAREWIVGTRYHPKDLYNDCMEMMVDIFNSDGEIIDQVPLFEKFERAVEDRGDGTGNYLWPRQMRKDGKWFGFDREILARKKAQYLNKVQFRAQYYNDPNDPDSAPIKQDRFQHYDKAHINFEEGYWHFKGERLNVACSIDFAFSLGMKRDFTAIVVCGMDRHKNIYVLDIERFKTDRIQGFFEAILRLHNKWGFRRLRCEASAAQKAVVKELKEQYIKKYGLAVAVDEYTPNRTEGTKIERIAAILEPRYDNLQIWHYKGGNCQILEEELVQKHPPHDDVKDALAACIDTLSPPLGAFSNTAYNKPKSNIIYSRFGGA